jgi:manganese/zinc/iron transport system substrate-binding protein
MRPLAIVLAVACLAATGCPKSDGRPARPDLTNRKAKVIATTGMIADAARAVGGEYVEVEALMGPGVDPHLFVATPRDLARIQSADLVLYNGLHLEGKMTDLFEQRSKTSWTVGVAEHLPDLLDAEEGFEGTKDPHVWFDVRLWIKVVEKVRDTLSDLDPARAAQYQANAGKYVHQLEELDRWVREQVTRIPSERRVLISAHDAFRYFGRAYGLEVRGLQGVSTAGDTSARDVQELADLIGGRKIKAVFAETSVSDKGMRAVREAVRDKYNKFDVRIAGDQLYSDALGEPGSRGETYDGMVRHNVEAIVRALAD